MILKPLNYVITWYRLFLFTCSVIVLSCDTTFSVFINLGYTARQRALANASSTISDEGSVFSNPAGLTRIKGVNFSASYSVLHLGLTDNSQISDGVLILSKSLPYGGVGLGYSRRTLNSLYQESLLNLGYGLTISEYISSGINLSGIMVEYGISEYSESNPYFIENGYSKVCFTYDFGLLFDLSEHFTFAFTAGKINQPDIGLGEESLIPVNFIIGGNYRGNKTKIFIEGSFSSYKNVASIGIEQPISDESFILRGGFIYGDYSLSASTIGFAWKTGFFDIDYAYRYTLSDLPDSGSHLVTIKFRRGTEKKVTKD